MPGIIHTGCTTGVPKVQPALTLSVPRGQLDFTPPSSPRFQQAAQLLRPPPKATLKALQDSKVSLGKAVTAALTSHYSGCYW